MKFILLTHERELLKGTNTGRIVNEVLGGDVIIILWKRKQPNDFLVNLLDTKKAALVFPVNDTEDSDNTPENYEYLVILDATWQEARKMFNRSSYLNQADRVSVKTTKPSVFKLRRNQIEGGLSTAECVIALLGHQNTSDKRQLLEQRFELFNQ
ncbi:MAG: DTW domain-containing protein YfiP [Oleiphilaceae bacterium]|jgi:DTW domain-containing protein YfiP